MLQETCASSLGRRHAQVEKTRAAEVIVSKSVTLLFALLLSKLRQSTPHGLTHPHPTVWSYEPGRWHDFHRKMLNRMCKAHEASRASECSDSCKIKSEECSARVNASETDILATFWPHHLSGRLIRVYSSVSTGMT